MKHEYARIRRKAAHSLTINVHSDKVIFMKIQSKQEVRERLVSNALGSLRIENMRPSQALQQGLESYVSGQKSIIELLGEVKHRHVTLRRG